MSKSVTISERIAALQSELVLAKDAERKEKEARLKAFRKQWQFTIAPQDKHWDKIYDATIKRYYLSGCILNADEYKAIGGEPTKGGMSYLYNTLTKCIVMREGGGSIYIPDDNFGKGARNTGSVYAALATFIAANPDGGDVTPIIVNNPEFRW